MSSLTSAVAPARAERPPMRLSHLGDELLARQAARGSDRAFAAIYERYHQQLYRYCRSILHDDADAQDALQSAFAGALQALKRDSRSAPLRPWLYRIAHNEAISLLRRRRRDATDELDAETLRTGPSVEQQAADRARWVRLVADLGRLPERQRGALLLRELSGLSHDEIAIALGTSSGAAKQAIFEARQALTALEEGRSMSCEEARRRISEGDRRVLRGRRVGAHLRACAACEAFALAIPTRQADLHAMTPALPPAVAAAVLARALGASSTPGATGAATAGAGAAGKAAGVAMAWKAAAGIAVIAATAAGVSGLRQSHRSPARTRAVQVARPASSHAAALRFSRSAGAVTAAAARRGGSARPAAPTRHRSRSHSGAAAVAGGRSLRASPPTHGAKAAEQSGRAGNGHARAGHGHSPEAEGHTPSGGRAGNGVGGHVGRTAGSVVNTASSVVKAAGSVVESVTSTATGAVSSVTNTAPSATSQVAGTVTTAVPVTAPAVNTVTSVVRTLVPPVTGGAGGGPHPPGQH